MKEAIETTAATNANNPEHSFNVSIKHQIL